MLCHSATSLSLALAAPSPPPPIWCLCNAPTSSSQRQTNRSEWKTISHIPLASYVIDPIVTQHVMYVYILACSRPSNRGVKSPIVFFPSTFATRKNSVRFRKVLSSFTTCAREKLPRKATAKQNDWNRGPKLASLVSILPQSHPKNPPPKKPTPTKIFQQIIGARQHDITAITSSLHPCMRHVALHQVNGPGI